MLHQVDVAVVFLKSRRLWKTSLNKSPAFPFNNTFQFLWMKRNILTRCCAKYTWFRGRGYPMMIPLARLSWFLWGGGRPEKCCLHSRDGDNVIQTFSRRFRFATLPNFSPESENIFFREKVFFFMWNSREQEKCFNIIARKEKRSEFNIWNLSYFEKRFLICFRKCRISRDEQATFCIRMSLGRRKKAEK